MKSILDYLDNTVKNYGDKLIESLDYTEDDEESNPYELIEGGASAEDEFLDSCGEWSSPAVAEYFSKLSPMQMEIAKLKSEGYTFEEIAQKLGITLSRYYELCNDMTSIEKTRSLISSKNKTVKKEVDHLVATDGTKIPYKEGIVPNGDAFVVFRFSIANCGDIHVDYPWIS